MTRREREIAIAAECARIDISLELSNYTDSIDHIDDIKDKNLSYDELVEYAFIKGVKWADNNPKSPLISVKDDLPCNHEELSIRGHCSRDCVYNDNGRCDMWNDFAMPEDVNKCDNFVENF